MTAARRFTSVLLCLALGAAACGSDGATLATTWDEVVGTPAPTATPDPACAVSPDIASTGVPPASEDRRFEDITALVTGDDRDEVAKRDPNFGGIWGDFRGGVVLAVLDCALVDADELARMAGGPDHFHLIEVSHTQLEVEAFRDQIIEEMRERDIDGDAPIDSTLQGKIINVWVEDLSALPADFASDIPRHLFTVTGPEPPTPSSEIPPADADAVVDCLFPVRYASLTNAAPADPDDPAFGAIVDFLDRQDGGEFGEPADGWLVLDRTDDRAVFAVPLGDLTGPEPTLSAMQAERFEAGWGWAGSAAGGCSFRLVLDGVSQVGWSVVDGIGPESSSISLLAREVNCDFPRLADRMQDPVVTETADEVRITLVAEPGSEGMECPLDEREWTEVEIRLDSPLGSRTLRDGLLLLNPWE